MCAAGKTWDVLVDERAGGGETGRHDCDLGFDDGPVNEGLETGCKYIYVLVGGLWKGCEVGEVVPVKLVVQRFSQNTITRMMAIIVKLRKSLLAKLKGGE